MKRKGILFSILSILCIGYTSGCNGKDTYYVEVGVESQEHGYATGSGNYQLGSPVMLKFYPNLGCNESTPEIVFEKSGAEPQTVGFNYSNDGGYYYINEALVAERVGKYTAKFVCGSNTAANIANDNKAKHKVSYVLLKEKEDGSGYVNYNEGLELVDRIYFGADGATNEEEIASGLKINSGNPISYHEKLEGKITWYGVTYHKDSEIPEISELDFEGETPYDFNLPVGNNIVLYGIFDSSDSVSVVKDAIDEFNKVVNMSATEQVKAWMIGLDVADDKLDTTIEGAQIGDLYLNEETLDLYALAMNGQWEKEFNFKEKYAHYALESTKWIIGDAVSNTSLLQTGIADSNVGDLYLYVKKDENGYLTKDSYKILEFVGKEKIYDNNGGFTINDRWELLEDLKISEAYTADLTKSSLNSSDGKLEIVVKQKTETSSVTKSMLFENGYYIYKDTSSKSGFKFGKEGLNASEFEWKEIEALYKYFEVSGVNFDTGNFTVVKRTNNENVKIEDKDVSCFVYDLNKEGNLYMTVYISKGKIYKVVTKDHTITYTYGKANGVNLGDSRNMYLVRLYSEDSKLSEELEGYSDDFEKILKVVPGYGDTIESVMLDDAYLSKVLKKYNYTLKTGKVDEQTGKCNGGIYVSGSNITSHRNLCLVVNASFDDVQTAIEKTGVKLDDNGNMVVDGRFVIKTSAIAFGELSTKSYDVSSDLTVKPSDMNTVIWDSLRTLSNLLHKDLKFGRFEYVKKDNSINSPYIYKFYEEVNSTSPYLSIELGEDGRISEIVYYEYGDSKITTYTSTFDYSKYDSLNMVVEKIYDGDYILSGSEGVVVKGKDISSLLDQAEENAIISELVELLQGLNENIEKYTFEKENNKYTYEFVDNDSSVHKYEFIFDEEKIAKLSYSVDKEGTEYDELKEFEFDYFHKIVDSIKEGGYILSDGTTSIVAEGEIFETEGEYEIVDNLLAILETLGGSGFTFDSATNTYTIVSDNGTVEDVTDDITYTYVFTVVNGRVTKLVYSVDKAGDENDSSVEYEFNHVKYELFHGFQVTMSNAEYIYIKQGNDWVIVGDIISDERPENISEEDWELMASAIRAALVPGSLNIDYSKYSYDNGKHIITSGEDVYKFTTEKIDHLYFIKSIENYDGSRKIEFCNNVVVSNVFLSGIEQYYKLTEESNGFKVLKNDTEVEVVIEYDETKTLEEVVNDYSQEDLDAYPSLRLLRKMYEIKNNPFEYKASFNLLVVTNSRNEVVIKFVDNKYYLVEGEQEFGDYVFENNYNTTDE